jgi:hypothetical protein
MSAQAGALGPFDRAQGAAAVAWVEDRQGRCAVEVQVAGGRVIDQAVRIQPHAGGARVDQEQREPPGFT